MSKKPSTRIFAAASATVLAGALGLAFAQAPSDDVINQAAERGSRAAPAQVEVDNGEKPQADLQADRAAPSAELPPKPDRN